MNVLTHKHHSNKTNCGEWQNQKLGQIVCVVYDNETSFLYLIPWTMFLLHLSFITELCHFNSCYLVFVLITKLCPKPYPGGFLSNIGDIHYSIHFASKTNAYCVLHVHHVQYRNQKDQKQVKSTIVDEFFFPKFICMSERIFENFRF